MFYFRCRPLKGSRAAHTGNTSAHVGGSEQHNEQHMHSSDFPGTELQLDQPGSISIGGLPKWCGRRWTSMGLKIPRAGLMALMWPHTLWCVWFYVSQWKPSNDRCKRGRTPHQDYSSSLTHFTKAVIRAKEKRRHPRHVEKRERQGRDEDTQEGEMKVDADCSSVATRFFLSPPPLCQFPLCALIRGAVTINKPWWWFPMRAVNNCKARAHMKQTAVCVVSTPGRPTA